jgi:hypothetical protein
MVQATSAWIAFVAPGITTAGLFIRGCTLAVGVVMLFSVRGIGHIGGIWLV